MPGKTPNRSARPGMDEYGRTPLHYAASDAMDERVTALITHGHNPNAKDDNGWTPLHFAAQSNASRCVKILLDAGADSSLEDSNGNSPLLRAVFSSKGDGAVIRELRAAGADPTQKNLSGVSPISLAGTIANYPVAQFFSDMPSG
jgi:ankyrin repeat protein